MKANLPLIILGLLSSAAISASAYAAAPSISGEVAIEVQNDWVNSSDDATAEVNTLTTKIEPFIEVKFTENLSLQTALVLEQVQAPDAGDDTYFENEGLFAQELKIVYNFDRYEIQAGKFNPAFGVAWDVVGGIYGTDFAEDYETTEKIGLGGSVNFETKNSGSHTLSVASYWADTTSLSESTITKRGRTKKSSGGVSNTEDFSSFAAALDGKVNKVGYHLGLRHQSAGDADPAGTNDETAYAGALMYSLDLDKNLSVDLLGELVHISDLDGTADKVNYVTLASTFTYMENWNIAVSYTDRNKNVSAGTDEEDWMFQASAGYAFKNGLTLDAGYRLSEEAGIDAGMFGALATYSYQF